MVQNTDSPLTAPRDAASGYGYAYVALAVGLGLRYGKRTLRVLTRDVPDAWRIRNTVIYDVRLSHQYTI